MQLKFQNQLGTKSFSIRLAIIFSLSLVCLILFHLSRKKIPLPCYTQMMQAAHQMQDVLAETRQYRQKLGLPINPVLDPALSGLIGEEITPLTTTLGNLEAKQTALNPDFAALITRWLWELEIQSRETVALQLSGSFPSLNIAAIIACEIVEANPVITSSIGASSFGANLPEMTYADVEKRLFERGIIRHRSQWITIGGLNDREILLWEDSDSLLNQVIRRTEYPLLHPNSLQESIQKKWEFFHSKGGIKVFINVGGNQAALGNCSHSSRLPVGLVREAAYCQDDQRGLLMQFLERGTPVIQFLNVRSLAIRENLPITPTPPYFAGQSDIYFKISHPVWIKIILVIFLLISWLFLRTPYRIPRSSSTTSTSIR